MGTKFRWKCHRTISPRAESLTGTSNTHFSYDGQAMPELTTEVWTGRGFNPKEGTLRLADGRLRFELDGQGAFDANVAELKITWPWYRFGCQFLAHTVHRQYFISFVDTGHS